MFRPICKLCPFAKFNVRFASWFQFANGKDFCKRAATNSKRILCRIVDIAGSKEQPGYKFRCLYGLLEGLYPTSTLVVVLLYRNLKEILALLIRLETRSL